MCMLIPSKRLLPMENKQQADTLIPSTVASNKLFTYRQFKYSTRDVEMGGQVPGGGTECSFSQTNMSVFYDVMLARHAFGIPAESPGT
jgi:hypothetical protein